jgi:hypothetical protein
MTAYLEKMSKRVACTVPEYINTRSGKASHPSQGNSVSLSSSSVTRVHFLKLLLVTFGRRRNTSVHERAGALLIASDVDLRHVRCRCSRTV